MVYKKVKRKLRKLYEDELKNIIFKHNGSYIVYDIYSVTKINNLWEVRRYGDFIHFFGTSAPAISWCISDKALDVQYSNLLIYIDSKIQRRNNDIALNRLILSQSIIDSFKKYVLMAKISNDIHITKSLKLDMINSMKKYKYIQIKGFLSNELKRPNPKYNSKTN